MRITTHINYPAIRRPVPPFRPKGKSLCWEWQEDDLITKGWEQGLTVAEIAYALPHRTRNAVIGRAHRLNLPKRPSPIKRGA